MLVYSEVNSPARQLFSCCNDCSIDKALLTRMRQEEVEDLIPLSTKKLQEIYDFDSEYLTSKFFSRNSTQSSNVLTYPFKCSSTSAFIAKQSDYEKIRPKDTWHWKTRNLLNNSDVSKCGKTKSYLTPEICRKEFIKLSKSSSLSRKYRQMTILKILPRWHEQILKLDGFK
ncbi:unnamed protein product [Schistosoma curassoni]|nr:unnamed protein product [Schistosoma curassoni]